MSDYRHNGILDTNLDIAPNRRGSMTVSIRTTDSKKKSRVTHILKADAPAVAAKLLKAAGHDGLADLIGWGSAEKKLQERRDAIALELSETGHTYDTASPMTRRAIDRIIELEDGK